MKKRLTKLLPPGYPYRAELYYYIFGMACAIGFSLRGWAGYLDCYNQLKLQSNYWKVVLQGRYMDSFSSLFESCFWGFWLLGASMAVWMFLHYASFRDGSKSIYLMKRLPDRTELWRRCLAVPLLEMAGAVLSMVVLAAIYYGIYCWATPDAYLQPGEAFWRVLL